MLLRKVHFSQSEQKRPETENSTMKIASIKFLGSPADETILTSASTFFVTMRTRCKRLEGEVIVITVYT